MKKHLLLLVLSFILGANCTLASENPSDKYKKKVSYPSAQNYSKPLTPVATPTKKRMTPTSSSSSSPLSAEAKRILNAAISRNHSTWQSAMQQFVDKGGIPGDTNVTSKCPRNPKLPSITVNGNTFTGNTCAKMTYTYKGQSYEEGFCK